MTQAPPCQTLPHYAVSFNIVSGPDLGVQGAQAGQPQASSHQKPPTKKFQFYFSLMIDAYETTI